jgi:hydrogenase maturation protease
MKYIIGSGNYSMFDDSIGIRVIEYIMDNNLENNFNAVELAGNALNLLTYLDEKTEKILIIDTAKMNLKAGEFRFFKPENVISEKELAGFSTHEGDLIKVIELGKRTGHVIPEILFMGIEPSEIRNEFGVSGILEEKIGFYAETAIKKINSSN